MGVALIKPLAPLHLGEATGALERISETIHADTLFSALCHAWGHLYGKGATDDLLLEFTRRDAQSEPPFMLTSCFPFIEPREEGAGRIYYLPAPQALKECFSPELRKGLKEISLIDLTVYRKWIEGSLEDSDIARIRESGKALEAEMGVKANVHVALDRSTLAGVPFYVSRLHCSERCGFYSLYSCRGEYADRFKGALRLLGDMGIGGERSSGCGAFRADFVDEELLPISEPGAKGAWMSLTLIYPTQSDLNRLAGAQIRLRERKGWVSSPFTSESYRRKRVFMMEEGSIFSEKIEGCLVDVTPSIWNAELHRVYRYGLAWLIPARS